MKQVEVIFVSSDETEQGFKEHYAKMPWLTYHFNHPKVAELKSKFEIMGVPMVVVCEAQTGFAVTKKGRKDIFDLGISCIRNWTEDMPAAKKKYAVLAHGAEVVKQNKLDKFNALRAKLDADKENE